MILVRRQFLHFSGTAFAFPATLSAAWAQSPQGGPKLTQLLRADLQGQDHKVQETVVNVLELGPGIGAPWHMHPGAQELLYVLEGNVTVELEGQGTKALRTGETVLIAAEIPHLARNENVSVAAKALVIHSRSDKDKPFVVPVRRST